jgi:3-hydroxy acid dehydrogenase/malonic semialdehyde reductase
MKTIQKRALISGASSGIGRAMAIAMGERGYELFLLARRQDRLEEVSSQIKNSKTHLIVANVNAPNLADIIANHTNNDLDILINNAGLALGREKVEFGKFEDWQSMIDTNITANFRLVNIVMPMLLKKGEGDIINLCSIAGHYSYQGGAVYCATKHAVLAFTRALREETAGRNIRVMQISPGMVDTEFSQVRFKGDIKTAQSVYAGMTPLQGEDIARMMLFMLDQPRHVVIDEIITMPQDQGSPTTIHRKSV